MEKGLFKGEALELNIPFLEGPEEGHKPRTLGSKGIKGCKVSAVVLLRGHEHVGFVVRHSARCWGQWRTLISCKQEGPY